MRKQVGKAILIILTVIIFSACSASFEDELQEAGTTVEAEFHKQAEKANQSNNEIQYYLPFGVEKESETPNNILLKNGSRTYLLFYNQHEDSKSKIVYESTLKQFPEWDGHLIFEKDGKFGYLLVKKAEDGVYQVVTGIGGVKVTTETTNIKSDATVMMRIVNSVKTK